MNIKYFLCVIAQGHYWGSSVHFVKITKCVYTISPCYSSYSFHITALKLYVGILAIKCLGDQLNIKNVMALKH